MLQLFAGLGKALPRLVKLAIDARTPGYLETHEELPVMAEPLPRSDNGPVAMIGLVEFDMYYSLRQQAEITEKGVRSNPGAPRNSGRNFRAWVDCRSRYQCRFVRQPDWIAYRQPFPCATCSGRSSPAPVLRNSEMPLAIHDLARRRLGLHAEAVLLAGGDADINLLALGERITDHEIIWPPARAH